MNSKYKLKWNDFQSKVLDIHNDWRNSSDFHDILLICCDNKSGSSHSKVFKAHKLILCSASSVFNEILSSFGNPHNGYQTLPPSSLYMHGVSPDVIQYILDFIYCGEVCVEQENLDAFMSVAERFNIRGLTEEGQQGTTTSNYTTDVKIEDGASMTIKIEEDDSMMAQSTSQNTDNNATFRPSEVTSPSTEYLDQSEDSMMSTFKNEEDADDLYDEIGNSASNNDSGDPRRKRDFIDANCTETDKGFYCLLCNISLSCRSARLRHFNEKHIDTDLCYCCPCCGVQYKVKRHMRSHIRKHHPDLIGADLSKFTVQNSGS